MDVNPDGRCTGWMRPARLRHLLLPIAALLIAVPAAAGADETTRVTAWWKVKGNDVAIWTAVPGQPAAAEADRGFRPQGLPRRPLDRLPEHHVCGKGRIRQGRAGSDLRDPERRRQPAARHARPAQRGDDSFSYSWTSDSTRLVYASTDGSVGISSFDPVTGATGRRILGLPAGAIQTIPGSSNVAISVLNRHDQATRLRLVDFTTGSSRQLAEVKGREIEVLAASAGRVAFDVSNYSAASSNLSVSTVHTHVIDLATGAERTLPGDRVPDRLQSRRHQTGHLRGVVPADQAVLQVPAGGADARRADGRRGRPAAARQVQPQADEGTAQEDDREEKER